ncbi:hypothetical protein EIP86_000136 [Pleurotus ostreatoroseus]|nr:hypothetical protein EIP86_000136 [Pleurotus ostreatoroseus]
MPGDAPPEYAKSDDEAPVSPNAAPSAQPTEGAQPANPAPPGYQNAAAAASLEDHLAAHEHAAPHIPLSPEMHGMGGPMPFPAFPTLHTTTVPEPALRGSVFIRVLPRCGAVGFTDKVEWRLYSVPPAAITIGTRVALCDAMGSYRRISRTVGPMIGADRHWVTFVLSAGFSAPATIQTLTIPRANAALPLLLRILLLLVACLLADEHPLLPVPLPDLD